MDLQIVLAAALVASFGSIAKSQADECHTFSPDEISQDSLLVLDRVNHQGYSDHGSLRWPEGKTFFLRHKGYNDDMSVFWPNGEEMVRRHAGYSDDNSVFWPNGKEMLRRHAGYSDDGSTFHASGEPWLLRHRGYGDDKSRSGGSRSVLKNQHHDVVARIAGDNAIDLRAASFGQDWVVTVEVSGEKLTVTECLLDDEPRPQRDLAPLHRQDDPHRQNRDVPSVDEIREGLRRNGHYEFKSSSYSRTEVTNAGSTRRRSHSAVASKSASHPSQYSTAIEDNFDTCVDWAYKLNYTSLNSDAARSAARTDCRDTDLSVARLLQPLYFKSLNAAQATSAALKDGSHAILAQRLPILEFAFEGYFKSLNGAEAARKAATQTRSLPPSGDSSRQLACLQEEFKIYFRSLNGDQAMTKAFQACSR